MTVHNHLISKLDHSHIFPKGIAIGIRDTAPEHRPTHYGEQPIELSGHLLMTTRQ